MQQSSLTFQQCISPCEPFISIQLTLEENPLNQSLDSQDKPSNAEIREAECRLEMTDVQAFRWRHQHDKGAQFPCVFQLIRIKQPSSTVTLEDLNCLDFPVLSYRLRELEDFARMVIEECPERRLIGKKFNLPKLLRLIGENYSTVAYHNFSHAFSLMLLLGQSVNRNKALHKQFTAEQWFYCLIAALAHDISHKGTNNGLEVKKKSELALLYKNEAVLENMHINHLWNMLKNNSQINFLHSYTSLQANHIRKLITRLILATDVSRHFKSLQALKAWRQQTGGQQRSGMISEHSQILLEQLFHACDIGNPCLDMDGYLNWAALLSFEFDQQARQESRLGLEVTPNFTFVDLKGFYKGQVGFVNGLVLPLWKELAIICPGLTQMEDNIQRNLQQLKARLVQQEPKHMF